MFFARAAGAHIRRGKTKISGLLRHSFTTLPPEPPVSSLRTTRTLALTHRAAHTEHRPTHSPRTTRAHSTTRIRRHLPRRSSHVPSAHRTSVPHAPATTARLPAEVLKLQDFSFYQSISNFIVNSPNVSEKDVKGLLFRK